MINYDDMSLDEIVSYINKELLLGRSMKDIEINDFGVNERVITKRLYRKNIKKVDGQFVLQSGSKMPKMVPKPVVTKVSEEVSIVTNPDNNFILSDNKEFVELKNKVDILEKVLKEIVSTQSGSNMVTKDFDFKIYSSDDKPVAKTIRLYKEIWDKIDKVKELYPHITYQTLLNSLLEEVTEKYLSNQDKNC